MFICMFSARSAENIQMIKNMLPQAKSAASDPSVQEVAG
jgi:hypothetical protein